MSSPHPATPPSRAKLFTQHGLQDLRVRLFQLELLAISQMIDRDVDATSIAVRADLDRAVERLQHRPARERS
jgi:hypothetical protein